MSDINWVVFGLITSYFVILVFVARALFNDLSRINQALLHILDATKYTLDLHLQSGYVFVEHDKRLKALEKPDLSNYKFEGE